MTKLEYDFLWCVGRVKMVPQQDDVFSGWPSAGQEVVCGVLPHFADVFSGGPTAGLEVICGLFPCFFLAEGLMWTLEMVLTCRSNVMVYNECMLGRKSPVRCDDYRVQHDDG